MIPAEREEMRRRLFIVLLILSGIILTGWEVRRAFLAGLMWRQQYAALERWGGDSCFIPALRGLYDPRGKTGASHPDLCQWARRRYQSRFHDHAVQDLAWLPSDQLVLLLRQTPGGQESMISACRFVVLDLTNGERMVGESRMIEDVSGCDFGVRYFPAWAGPTFLLNGYGSGDNAILLRRRGDGFTEFRWKDQKSGEHPFHSWGDLEVADIDGDGIPEVRGWVGKWATCPHCGREGEANVVTWKLVDGSYRKWTERGAGCGLNCERAWSN